MLNIKDIINKHEAVLKSLKQQAARALEQKELREEKLRKEINQTLNLGLDVVNMAAEFLEWNNNVFLVQEQRVRANAEYKNELIKHVIGVRNQNDKLVELEEELEIKDEDIERLTDENKALTKELEDKYKEIDVLNELVKRIGDVNTNKEPTPLVKVAKDMTKSNKTETKVINDGRRRCVECGCQLYGLAPNAKLCRVCALKRKRVNSRKSRRKIYRERKKKAQEKQENVSEELDENQEESEEEPEEDVEESEDDVEDDSDEDVEESDEGEEEEKDE